MDLLNYGYLVWIECVDISYRYVFQGFFLENVIYFEVLKASLDLNFEWDVHMCLCEGLVSWLRQIVYLILEIVVFG